MQAGRHSCLREPRPNPWRGVRVFSQVDPSLPWLWTAAALLALAGLSLGLLLAPTDPLQGDAMRIAFVHLPASWVSMLLCLALAASAIASLALDGPLAPSLMAGIAPTGALMSLVALWTGAMWNKPTTGSWWVWDERASILLLLLGMHLGLIALRWVLDDPHRAERAGAWLALAGSAGTVSLGGTPWAGLHGSPTADLSTRLGLASMLAAFTVYALACTLHRTCSLLIESRMDPLDAAAPGPTSS